MMRNRLAAILAAGCVTVALTMPVLGITFGHVDDENQYANVAAVVAEVDAGYGVLPYVICTGTLIEDGDGGWSNLVLTAAHCIEGDRMWVTFDPTTDVSAEDGSLPTGSSPLYGGVPHAHPGTACCGRNDPSDIAVIVLDHPVEGIAPATIATPGLLDQLTVEQLRRATFVTAGYGYARTAKSGGLRSLSFDGDRRFVEQTYMSLLKPWLNLSQQPSTGDGGTCAGDSGGPHFLDGVIVSITVIGDAQCRATDKTYRIDTPNSQAFIRSFMTP